MRIGLDLRYVYDHFPGIGRYSFHLAQALSHLEHPHTLVLLHNPALTNHRYHLADLRSGSAVELVATTIRPFSLAEQIALPHLVRALRLDLLHSPYYIKPYVGLPCLSLVTIHDLIGRRFSRTLSRRGRWLFRLTIGLAVRSAAHIITVSEHSRHDIAHAYRLPPSRISVTSEAAAAHFCPQPPARIAAVRARYGLPQRYVLYLGANKPHKNLPRLVQAWQQMQHEWSHPDPLPRLVLAGHQDPRYPTAHQIAAQHGLSHTVQCLPDVAEEDLPALYSGADLFVFPSYYEGFGLPPLEAMACGTPVLCAAASSLPEVVGTAALLVDPYSVGAIAAGLTRLLNSADLRAHLREQGLQQAARFSWQRTARATLDVYERVV